MKIILVVGKFPTLSETFIIRKAIFLIQQGHDLLILARRKGDLEILKSIKKSNNKIKYEFLIPEFGPYKLIDIYRLIFLFIKIILTHPIRMIKLIFVLKKYSNDNFIKNFIKYLGFVNKQNFDIIHFEFITNTVGYKLLPHLLNCKLVSSCRGTDLHTLPLKPREFQLQMRNVIQYIDGIHCVSNELKENFIRQFPDYKPELVFINKPAISFEDYIINTGLPKVQNVIPIIITVGRIEWIKGLDYLLKSLNILKIKGYRFSSIILGDGSLKSEIQFSIEDLNLIEEVELPGKIPPDQIFLWLKRSDIFVLSSHDEGISNAALEAMAIGLPVVSTAVGGMPEVLKDGEDGLLVPPRDPEALADKIALLLDDPDLRTQLGRKARQKVLEGMTLQQQAEIFESQYRRILGG